MDQNSKGLTLPTLGRPTMPVLRLMLITDVLRYEVSVKVPASISTMLALDVHHGKFRPFWNGYLKCRILRQDVPLAKPVPGREDVRV